MYDPSTQLRSCPPLCAFTPALCRLFYTWFAINVRICRCRWRLLIAPSSIVTIEVSASAHTTHEVVIIVVVIASPKELLWPALKRLLKYRHKSVWLLVCLTELLSRNNDRGATRGWWRCIRHDWRVVLWSWRNGGDVGHVDQKLDDWTIDEAYSEWLLELLRWLSLRPTTGCLLAYVLTQWVIWSIRHPNSVYTESSPSGFNNEYTPHYNAKTKAYKNGWKK